ncbi:hypothetical protein BVG16_13515 [Paenibacillus selenitireducens]|uniref:Uncharacterized protein n=1 Tax=Paenibacillus selenitireducens TaxID=1324314 RepID=A0A1T2XCB3_9BACL|nr:hypothetical protein [Paenibacillus selenitireducens]OPA77468.1 hypothetical protein BVG16_13515 [Paenibacillus selenitireducens]
MNPIVFDGVGTMEITELDGTLKLIDDKITKVNFQAQLDWQKVMGGDSGYAFHYTAQDLQDKVSIELPRFSTALAEISQGADTINGTVEFNETEEGILSPTNGYSIKATTKFGGTLVDKSDSVYLKDPSTGELKKLERVAATPTATQYMIANGKITSNASNDNKNIVVRLKWSTTGTKSALSGKRRPKPFKFTHRFELVDDRSGKPVQCQLTIHKALGGGTLDVSQERKKPSTSTLALEIMEPDITPDNPNGYAAELIFGI